MNECPVQDYRVDLRNERHGSDCYVSALWIQGMTERMSWLRPPCLNAAKPSEWTGKPWLRLPCLSTAKPSEQTGKPWLRLPCLSAAKLSEQTGKLWLRLPKCLRPGGLIILLVFASRPSALTSSWELSEILQLLGWRPLMVLKRTFSRVYVGVRRMQPLDIGLHLKSFANASEL